MCEHILSARLRQAQHPAMTVGFVIIYIVVCAYSQVWLRHRVIAYDLVTLQTQPRAECGACTTSTRAGSC